jgi:hypothetical protein
LWDIDGDGELEVVGKSDGAKWGNPKFMMWKKTKIPSKLSNIKHTFIDRGKPHTAVDILVSDVNGNGKKDILCGNWWYRNPDWKRFEIPGISQVINAYDIDGDGRDEIIAIMLPEKPSWHFYSNLNSRVCWVKPIDPENGVWERHYIGEGDGDWPHGSVIAPLLPGGKLALILGYHDANAGKTPELFEIPANPTDSPWNKRILANINYGEEFIVCDVDLDGKLDIVAGPYWLENMGDGTFKPYKFTGDRVKFIARIGVTDVNKDGRSDVIIGEEIMDFDNKVIPYSNVWWFENPEDPRQVPWKGHVIDSVRCAHSIGVGDLDGDGEDEIVTGEHDPFWPYRSQGRCIVYKKADPAGLTWKAYVADGRFEHHDGTKVVELEPGKKCIISHGWQDSIYIHMWEVE